MPKSYRLRNRNLSSSSVAIGYRNCEGLQLNRAFQTQLAQNIFAMLAHSEVAEIQRTCNFLASATSKHVRHYLFFTRRKRKGLEVL